MVATGKNNFSVQMLFKNWESIIALLPTHAQHSIRECFHLTTWFHERLLTGDPPIECNLETKQVEKWLRGST